MPPSRAAVRRAARSRHCRGARQGGGGLAAAAAAADRVWEAAEVELLAAQEEMDVLLLSRLVNCARWPGAGARAGSERPRALEAPPPTARRGVWRMKRTRCGSSSWMRSTRGSAAEATPPPRWLPGSQPASQPVFVMSAYCDIDIAVLISLSRWRCNIIYIGDNYYIGNIYLFIVIKI
jgi:hypothetical protein